MISPVAQLNGLEQLVSNEVVNEASLDESDSPTGLQNNRSFRLDAYPLG